MVNSPCFPVYLVEYSGQVGSMNVNLGLGPHCPVRMILTAFPSHLREKRLISSAPF